MEDFFKEIRSDKTIILTFFINIFFIFAILFFILVFYGRLPPFIPVFNQLPWGEIRLGSTITIFIPLVVALIIFGINLFVANSIYNKIPLMARMLFATSLLTSILTFLFVVKTITLIL